jgi:hypothetical protein
LDEKHVINDEIGGQAENVIYGFAKKRRPVAVMGRLDTGSSLVCVLDTFMERLKRMWASDYGGS